MEKYIIWYLLQLKAWCRRGASWLQTGIAAILILLLLQVHIPAGEEAAVGLYGSGDSMSQAITERLREEDSVFTFVSYTDEEKLRRDILSGKLICGFLFDRHFTEHVQDGNLQGQITYVTASGAVSAFASRETVFAAFLRAYGEVILSEYHRTSYGENRQPVYQTLLERYAYYLEQEDTFQVVTEYVPASSSGERGGGRVFPVQGAIGMILFLQIWMTAGRGRGDAVAMALDLRRRSIFTGAGYLASVTIPAILYVYMIGMTSSGRGILSEAAHMFLYVVVACLWVLAVGGRMRNSDAFAAWVLAFMVVQFLVCPVVFDLSVFIPSLKYIKYALPLGWYI